MNPHSISPLIERLGLTLLHSLWQGVLLAAALAVALAALRRAPAAWRHAAAFLALGLMAVCAAVTFARVEGTAESISSPPASQAIPSLASAVETMPDLKTESVGHPDATPPPTAPSSSASTTPTRMGDALTAQSQSREPGQTVKHAGTDSWSSLLRGALPWVVTAWSAGVALFSLWRLMGWWRLRQWQREGTPHSGLISPRLASRMKLRRPVRVLVTARALVPMLVSGLKPVILLPASVLSGLTPAQLEAVLAHELAHVRRWDDWLLLAQTALETLFFYHPAVWWMSRVIRREREFAADDLAAETLADRTGYAVALARVAELCADAAAPALGATSGGPMITRLRRLLHPHEPAPRLAGGMWGAAATMTVVTLLWLLPQVPAVAQENVITLQPGASIQAALDAAPEGAVLRLAAGAYQGCLLIEKNVTIEGASEGETVIVPSASLTPASAEGQALHARLTSAEGEEKTALQREYQRTVNVPTMRVLKGAVMLHRLRVDSIAPPDRDTGVQEAALVNHSPDRVTLENCRFVGPGTNGITQVAGAGPLEISRCLIAAYWRNGITTARGAKDVHVTDSDIRNCYYAGVVIGRGSRNITLERCLISGAAWHGVRYDDASPVIRHCRIWGNARAGIYASGNTEAIITGNVFWRNEGGGIWCWFDNRDLFEGNTFDHNLEAAISVLGASEPVIRRNIFAHSPAGLTKGRIADDKNPSQELKPLNLEGNVFWQTPVVLRDEEEKITTLRDEWKSRVEDPKLDANGVSALDVGAKTPVAAQSAWALTEGEKAIIPVGDARSYELWQRPPEVRASEQENELWQQAYPKAEPLIKEVGQLDSVERRDAALADILAKLQTDDADAQRVALVALSSFGDVDYDRKPFREPLRRLIRACADRRRASALSALSYHDPEPADLDLALSLADELSVDVREALPHALANLTSKDFTGKAGDVLLQQLNHKTYQDIRTPLGAVWGGIVSPALEAKIIELSRLPGEDGHNAIYFGLRTLREKGEPAARRLLELLAEGRDTTEALWGLQSGIPDAVKPEACEALIKFFAARLYNRSEALKAIRHCATSANRASLQALAAKPNLDEKSRAALQEIIAKLP